MSGEEEHDPEREQSGNEQPERGQTEPEAAQEDGASEQTPEPESPDREQKGPEQNAEQESGFLADADLTDEHRSLIRASAISEEVARARGYRTVKRKKELIELGFSERQQRVPTLLIPIWGVHGEVVNYQARPKDPRVEKGKAIKYETPRGSRMCIDVPPAARERLSDPAIPLYITEGARKADAGVSAGLCTISLLGVWNWRGTNEDGGKAALGDWEAIALNGRKVYLVFDSDVMTKVQVYRALFRLKKFLETRDAKVHVVYLPQAGTGDKVGLDDYLASGHTVEDLLRHAASELREPPGGVPKHPYIQEEDGIYLEKTDDEGETRRWKLCNFHARITADVVRDDGAEEQRDFQVYAGLHKDERSLAVPADEFGKLDWVPDQLGARAIIEVGQSTREHLRVAIHKLSDDIATVRVYQHTGWREKDGERIFLHAGGAIGKDGAVEGVVVRLEPPLDRFKLPNPPVGEGLRVVVRVSLQLFEGLAPDRIVFPLFDSVWRALLGDPNVGVHLVGLTGVRKTELAALAQRFFGEHMDALNLPGSWSSTANAMEGLAFLAKDVALVMDDFAPRGSANDVRRAHKDADRLFRGQGNHSGRRRMKPDGSLRPDRPPRGLIISTGEDAPSGHSLQARVVILPISKGDVNLARLSECQCSGASYAATTAGFVRWLAGRPSSFWKTIKTEIDKERDALIPHLPHGRTASAGGDLLVAARVFLRFAVEAGAIGEDEYQRLLARCRAGILDTLRGQASFHQAEDPARVYLEQIGAGLRSQAFHLVDLRKGGVPQYQGEEDEGAAALAGWRLAQSEDGEGKYRVEWRPGGERIGYIDPESEYVYLIPQAAHKAVLKQGADSPARIALGERMLSKALDEGGFLVSKDRDRCTKKIRAPGGPVNVLHLKQEDVFGGDGPGTPPPSVSEVNGTGGGGGSDLFPKLPPPFPQPNSASGTNPGPESAFSASPEGLVPAVPVVPASGGIDKDSISRSPARVEVREWTL